MLVVPLAMGVLPDAFTAEAERSGITGIMQGGQHDPQRQLGPHHLASASLAPAWKLQTLASESLHGAPSRTGASERGEEMAQTLLDLLVGVQHHALRFVINQSDRQWHLQLRAPGFVVNT